MKSTATRLLCGLAALLMIFAFAVPGAFAQTGTVTGTVTDAETGDTLPTVNLAIPSLNLGSATNVDGEYTIENVPPGTYTLRVSFVGYQTYTTEIEVEAGETITQDVEMESGAVGLEEVVVTGYGQQQTAAELTGSVSNIGADDVNEVPVQNAGELLQGRAAGVTMASTSGNPGGGFEVQIRGEGSINAGDNPLYIVDGVQMSFSGGAEETDRSPLNAIDPQNIESIQVLKDAAAAAIYGAQASNGVVLISTKSGSQGDTKVSVGFEGGVRFQSYRVGIADRDAWAQRNIAAFGEEVFRQAILTGFGRPADANLSELPDFNWQDYFYEPGPHIKGNFSASGGDENTQFFIGGNWQETDAAVKRAGYDQAGLRINLQQQLTSSFNLNAKARITNETNAGIIQDNNWIPSPFFQGVHEEPPIATPWTNDGDYYPDTEQGLGSNPAVELNDQDTELKTTQIITSLQPRFTLTPWLTLEGSFGLDYQDFEGTSYEGLVDEPGPQGQLQRRFGDVTNLTSNVTLNANRTFNDVHDLSVLVGSEYRREWQDEDETGVEGFGNPFIKVSGGASSTSFFQGFNTEFRLLSYFGRVNYEYDSRYIATVTARYDGSSRFGTGTRFGLFPSISGSWRISEESFFNADFVQELKLRASFGVTGNASIGNFDSRGLYSISESYRGTPGLTPDQLANPQLSWEENREVNVGVDYSLFSGRVSGSVNAYRSISDDLLLDRPLPQSSGFTNITENIGQVKNRGLEFEVETINIQTESVRWSTRANVSVTQNTVEELTPGVDELQPGDETPIAEGHSLEAWKVFDYAGVNPADGRPMFYDSDGNLTYRPSVSDRKFFDGAEEDVIAGFGTRFSYKGLSLDMSFDAAFGAKTWPISRTTASDAFGEGFLSFITDNDWEQPGDVAQYPKAAPFGSYANAMDPDFGLGGETSTFWIFKTNYLRLKSVRLSYSFPQPLLDRVGLRSGQIYVSGLNLWWVSPHINVAPTGPGSSTLSNYPTEQQINVGVQIGL